MFLNIKTSSTAKPQANLLTNAVSSSDFIKEDSVPKNTALGYSSGMAKWAATSKYTKHAEI